MLALRRDGPREASHRISISERHLRHHSSLKITQSLDPFTSLVNLDVQNEILVIEAKIEELRIDGGFLALSALLAASLLASRVVSFTSILLLLELFLDLAELGVGLETSHSLAVLGHDLVRPIVLELVLEFLASVEELALGLDLRQEVEEVEVEMSEFFDE